MCFAAKIKSIMITIDKKGFIDNQLQQKEYLLKVNLKTYKF
jgi:hypothetical protein